MARAEDVTLSPAFAAVAASGLDINSLTAVSVSIRRVPRLIVPIDVQGLRVVEDQPVEHADIATAAILEATATESDTLPEPTTTAPDPFTELAPRKPGVYLHWAVPDALARGEVGVEDEEELQPAAETTFPPLPNRWCVTRYWWAGIRFRTRSWVVEADRGRVVALESWAEVDELPDGAEAATPDLGPADLTAVMGGDAAWFAVYDNVVDRFAFRDDLADVDGSAGTANYSVVGWYSNPALDPIAGAVRLGGFDERLAELGWTADLSHLTEASKRLDGIARQTERIVEFGNGEPSPPGGVEYLADITQVPPHALKGPDRIISLPKPYWPQQSLFHGVLYSVPLGPGGRDPKPSPDQVEVGIGATSSEALSALMSENVDEAEEAASQQLLNALQYGVLAELETPDGPAKLADETHRRAFESRPGGFTTERIRAGDPFAHLRTPAGRPPDRRGYLVEAAAGLDNLVAQGVMFEFTSGDPYATREMYERAQPVGPVETQIDTSGTVRGAGSGPGGSFLDPPPFLGHAPSAFDPLRPVDPLGAEFLRKTDPILSARADQGIEYRTVKRALPRLFQPQDPVASLRGVGRTLRHHSNQFLDEEGRLVCRLSGTTISAEVGMIRGRELLEAPLFLGSIPPEAQELIEETVLETPGAGEQIASVVSEATRRTIGSSAVAKRLEGEERLFVNYLVPGSSAHELVNDSIKDGVFPSPKEITLWHQAWEPMYLEWELEVGLDTEPSHWSLGQVDIAPAGPLSPGEAQVVRGRSLLSKAGATSIAGLIASFLDEEDNLEEGEHTTGVVSGGALDDLREMNEAAGLADVLHASFDGLRDFFLGFSTNVRYTEPETEGEILPDRIPELLAAGVATVSRLRVVDAFGRFLDLPGPYSVADEVEVPDEAGADSPDTFLLTPRIVAPSRLWFRFVDAADDTRDALVDQENADLLRSPVAAWLLPDHVDGALEVFDPAGRPLGQLRNERMGSGVVWEGAPGRPGPMGRPPFMDIANRHASELARAMVARDAAERQARTDQKESTLDALLRAVDTTLWTVDPFAESGLDYYAKLTGRPIAVVRARLVLEVVADDGLFAEGDPRRAERAHAYDELSRRHFEVRLGALTEIDDGLLGYFVNDDYWRFHPVHASVRDQALASGPHQGYLAAEQEVADFDADQPEDPITHPYVVPDPKIDVQPGHPVRLTLLLDPATRVHATSGVVPRKAIGLPRAFVQDALRRIAPSFRFGPVLVDPGVIRMPKPSVLPEEQAWTRRDTPTSWKDDPIEAATQFAYLPDISHEAQEGYIRVRLDP
jgi:hypothetical protein